ncbi:MAG: hypothetical protein F4X66_12460 [Chloroflexi bacterium]|nr:hypothetical protein [Chloroflexota bacterium]MYE39116.1 hypothetical protein [Chloroflexota bacterium]
MTSTPDPERRVSIWSVPERWRKLFFAIFSIQTAALIGLAVWYEVFVKTGDSWPETIFAIGRDAAPGIGVIAADSVVIVDIVMILTLLYEDYRRKRTERALARLQEKWEGWNQRRLEADAAAQPFDEPPPSLTRNGHSRSS